MNEHSYEKQARPNSKKRKKNTVSILYPRDIPWVPDLPHFPSSLFFLSSIFFQLQGEDKYPIEISNARCFHTLTVFIYLRSSSKLHFLLGKLFFFKF